MKRAQTTDPQGLLVLARRVADVALKAELRLMSWAGPTIIRSRVVLAMTDAAATAADVESPPITARCSGAGSGSRNPSEIQTSASGSIDARHSANRRRWSMPRRCSKEKFAARIAGSMQSNPKPL